MTTTIGHMGIRWDWLIQVQTAPRRPEATRMEPPRTISWEVILGEANSFDKMGILGVKLYELSKLYHIPTIKIYCSFGLRVHCTFPASQRPMYEQVTYRNSVRSASTKWRHHCINTHCNFESALITTCIQAGPYPSWISSALTTLWGGDNM
jgi:hypothetical protein